MPQAEIFQTLNKATVSEFDRGTRAFLDYRDRINLITWYKSPNLYSLEQKIAVFAALSPNNSEDGNFRDLVSVLESYPKPSPKGVTAYPKNVEKAYGILAGTHWRGVIKGSKTTNFCLNLLNPCDPLPVTIDGHMISVWLGRRVNLKSREASIGDKKYYEIAEDFRSVARAIGLLPNQVQAITWNTWKRLHKIAWNPQMRLWS